MGIKSLKSKNTKLSLLSLSLLPIRRRPHTPPASNIVGRQPSSSVRRPLVSILAVSQMDTSTGGDGSSNKNSSSTASTKGVGVKQKTDIAWNYFEELIEENGSKVFRCLFCAKVYKGGGINRMKQHLAGITGQISRCLKVPFDVREKIQNNLTEFNLNKLEKKKAYASVGMTFHENRDTNNVVQNDAPLNTMDELTRSGSGGPVRVASVDDYFAPRTVAGAQPGIKAALAGKEALHRAQLMVAKFFYDAGFAFNAAHSPYYQASYSAAAAIGPGFVVPSYHALRTHLLADCKRECQLLVEGYCETWAKHGCTLMSDGWTDKRGRTLINFLVYCSRGLCFIKSVDATKEIKTAKVLFKMFDEVIKWIGVDNVVQVVTDNASNYLKCGKVIHRTYPHIYWTPCAAHCINLILKDIAALPHVSELFAKASKISVFVYNHQPVLNWLKAREGWKEIVRPAVTRFATHFEVLKSTFAHRADLRALFGSEFYIADSSSSTQKAMNVEKIVLDNMFWGDCLEIVKVVTPIMKLLRFVDSDEKPSLGYVYKGMALIIEGIKNIYPDNESKYKPYTDIVEKRVDKHFRGDMHRAAYYFNPALAYNHRAVLWS
ncbi:hypothetical protein LINPERHAP1_LOCUS13136 [Linum perenne]